MKFAYADPPYLGCGSKYKAHHSEAMVWDDPETHRSLISRLCDEYPDGWALSCHAPSLRVLLPMCPDDVRVAAWCKPFASFKPNVNPGYTWEPVLFRGGRKPDRYAPTVRDYLCEPITLMKGLPGAKPHLFCRWVIQLLHARDGDIFDDLFPGTRSFQRAWDEWRIDMIANMPKAAGGGE